jgi:rsbT antagonist protein RsbS
MDEGGAARIPLQISRDCVVASIQVDLSHEVLRRFREELLELLHSSGATGVILDVSGIAVMDLQDFEALRRTMAMARLMGAPSVLAGIQAGVVSSLVELGAETDDILAALDLDEAFRVMESLRGAAGELADEEDDDERLFAAPANQI